jgi:hypothetical protein
MYDTAPPSKEERRQNSRAASWTYDARTEAAIVLRDTDPAAYDRLSPGIKTGVGYYEAAKAAADAAGIDTTDTKEK